MGSEQPLRVAILGASPDPERYACKAQRALTAAGHVVLPVSPRHSEVLGVAAVAELAALAPGSVDAVTVYVAGPRVPGLAAALARLAPRCVILNPGADGAAAEQALAEAGLRAVPACTLVLLATDRFAAVVAGAAG
jgi:hypothetical protein